MSFAGKLSLRVSKSLHSRQILAMHPSDKTTFRKERCVSVSRWLNVRLSTNGGERAILSDNLSERDLIEHDHSRVKLIMVDQNAGVAFPGVGAHCVSIAR